MSNPGASGAPKALGSSADSGQSLVPAAEDHVHPTTGLALEGHDHDGRYYTEDEVDALLVALDIPGLADTTIDGTPAAGELLVADGADGWANQTPAEAGLSVDGHGHTEADITDLAHYDDTDAVAAMGVKGDANPLNHDRYTDAAADARIALANITDLASYAHADTSGKTASDHHDHGSAFCLVYPSSGQTIATSTWTALTWGAETADPSGWHNTSTNPERITPNLPTGTPLLISFWTTIGSPSGSPTAMSFRIMRNGVTDLRALRSAAPGSGYVHWGGSVLHRHVSGDYYTVEVWHDSGSNETTRSGAGEGHFSVAALGGLDAT